MEDLVGALWVDRHLGKNFFHGRNGEACRREGELDLRLGGGFVGVEANGGAGRIYGFSLKIDFLGGGEFGERGAERFGSH